MSHRPDPAEPLLDPGQLADQPAVRRGDVLAVLLLGATLTGLAFAVSVLLADPATTPGAGDRALLVVAVVCGVMLPFEAWALFAGRRRQHAVNRLQDLLRRRLETLSWTSREWQWTIERGGRVAYSSPRSTELFGYQPEELVGTDAARLVHPEDADRLKDVLRQAVATRHGFDDLLLRCMHRDGRERWVHATGVPILSTSGEVVAFEGSSRMVDADASQLLTASRYRRIRQVLRDGSMRTAFQPIVNLMDAQVVGVEALSRFPSDAQSPDAWFSDAASVGLGLDLELLAVREALRRAAELPAGVYLSVNVSPATLCSTELAELLDACGVEHHRIVLELTEHVSIGDYGEVRASADRLRSSGVRLAVDDAGAGYASFSHIVRLRPDFIKLDRALVSDIHTDPARRTLAASVVMFALELGATVVAEGVETEAELATVRTLGMDAAQGYLIARPSTDPREWSRWSTSLVVGSQSQLRDSARPWA